MNKRIINKIKQIDMYGHPVKLNFDKKSDIHKTWIGGFFSIIINIMLSIYVFINLKKLILKEQNHNLEIM